MIKNMNKEKGQIVIIVTTLFMMLSLTMILGSSGTVFRGQRMVSDLLESRSTYFLAEAGVEDVSYRLSNGLPYATSGQILTMDGHSVSVDTETVNGRKIVTATSDWNGNQRTVETRLVAGDGVAFYYGVQIGQGGFSIGNNSGINGSVYSNGSITGGNGSYITGTAVAVGSITNVDVGTSTTSDAWANSITNINVTGVLYCQSGSGNNKSCNNSKGVPPTVGYPLTDEEINGWKNDALVGGVTTGDVTVGTPTSLGPRKIVGNLIVNSTLTVTGTLWVTGTITVANGATIALSSGYGTSGGVVIADGTLSMVNNVNLRGSGTSNSYLIMLTTSNSSTAISIGNGNTTEVILYAPNGTIVMGNNANVRSLTARTISLGNNTILNYTQGLLDAVFNSGPSGGWQLDSWKETE
jgi:hypothetical protein